MKMTLIGVLTVVKELEFNHMSFVIVNARQRHDTDRLEASDFVVVSPLKGRIIVFVLKLLLLFNVPVVVSIVLLPTVLDIAVIIIVHFVLIVIVVIGIVLVVVVVLVVIVVAVPLLIVVIVQCSTYKIQASICRLQFEHENYQTGRSEKKRRGYSVFALVKQVQVSTNKVGTTTRRISISSTTTSDRPPSLSSVRATANSTLLALCLKNNCHC